MNILMHEMCDECDLFLYKLNNNTFDFFICTWFVRFSAFISWSLTVRLKSWQ